jgi:hypothetical protein
MKNNDNITKICLIAIAIGIWTIVLQNATAEQSVYVKGGYIDADVSGEVEISGSVDVDNTVSVSIDEVLKSDGKKYYYNNN